MFLYYGWYSQRLVLTLYPQSVQDGVISIVQSEHLALLFVVSMYSLMVMNNLKLVCFQMSIVSLAEFGSFAEHFTPAKLRGVYKKAVMQTLKVSVTVVGVYVLM